MCEKVDTQGWTNIAHVALMPPDLEPEASVQEARLRGQSSRLDTLHHLLPDEHICVNMLVPLNTQLTAARHAGELKDLRWLHDLTVPLWWLFFARWFLMACAPPPNLQKQITKLKKTLSSRMHHPRQSQ